MTTSLPELCRNRPISHDRFNDGKVPVAAFGHRFRIADLRRTSIGSNGRVWHDAKCVQPAMNRPSRSRNDRQVQAHKRRSLIGWWASLIDLHTIRAGRQQWAADSTGRCNTCGRSLYIQFSLYGRNGTKRKSGGGSPDVGNQHQAVIRCELRPPT